MIEEKKKYMKGHSGTDSDKVKMKSGKLKETYNNRGRCGGTHVVMWKFNVSHKWKELQ